jgi:hypothetical protein
MGRRRHRSGHRRRSVVASRACAIGLFVTLAVTPAGCGEEGTSPHPRFDLVDHWGTTFEFSSSGGLVRRFELTLEIDAVQGEVVTGSAVLTERLTLSGDGTPFTLSGRYRPPVVFVELRSATWPPFRLVGELTTSNLMEGTLIADAPEVSPTPVLLFRR